MAACAAALLAGCASETFAPDAAPEFVVIHNQTPFYHLGPQQTGPPDARLAKDDRLRMLRSEFGYSLMLLPDGRTGYVANEDLDSAPPLPIEKRGGLADEAPLPKPDLAATPADAPIVGADSPHHAKKPVKP